MSRVRIATRASDLALAQSRRVAALLEEKLGVDAELLPMKTTGDRLEGPLTQIAVNAGMEGGVVVEQVRSLEGNNGLNAATGEYIDLVEAGIIDAAKVTRSALQNAGSIAALFLTTEAVIADAPEDGAGGGMPDMDF